MAELLVSKNLVTLNFEQCFSFFLWIIAWTIVFVNVIAAMHRDHLATSRCMSNLRRYSIDAARRSLTCAHARTALETIERIHFRTIHKKSPLKINLVYLFLNQIHYISTFTWINRNYVRSRLKCFSKGWQKCYEKCLKINFVNY